MENNQEIDLLVIGAGPAGLSAASEAASHGISTIVLDMGNMPGGQYYHLPSSPLNVCYPVNEIEEGRALVKKVESAGVPIWQNVEVWGIYREDKFRVCISQGRVKQVFAKMIIAAPGAIERSLPFPGWTLPGVMSCGGALAILKNQQVLIGNNILLSGSGPLQLAVAAHLAEAGGNVHALLENLTLLRLFTRFQAIRWLPGQIHRLQEGRGYLKILRKHKVPVRMGWSVIAAHGQDQVESATIARIDHRGGIIEGTEQTIEVDTICIGNGLTPSTGLSRIVDCDHSFDQDLGTFIPVRNEWMETTTPGFFVVGDAVSIRGKNAAILEGSIAGIGIAQKFGAITSAKAADKARKYLKDLKKEIAFSNFLNHIFSPLPGLMELILEDTVVCRCENITYAVIKKAILDGADSVAGIKNHTRSGMGWCQGRMCWMNIARIIANEIEIPLEEASRHTVRPPLFPVTLGELMDSEDIR